MEFDRLTPDNPTATAMGWNMRKTARLQAVNDRGHVVGGDHHRAKLSDHDVWLIQELRAEGLTHKAIAQKFEVSVSTIESICLGRRRNQTATGQKARRT